ncbi:MAG: hypothetical protein ACTSYI_03475 [Promethearchaeota archaeon]
MLATLQIMLQLAPFLLKNLNSIIIGFNTLLGLIVFLRMMKHTRAELGTAPKYTPWQKLGNLMSGTVYSAIVACAVMFVFALISSMVAINALHYIHFRRPDLSNFFQLIALFQFPSFLPLVLLFMAVFAIFYSLFEYTLMARDSSDAPMEIQRWIEKTFIDRFRAPWSWFMAIIVFFVVVLLTPIITSFFSVQYWGYLPPNALKWIIVVVFLLWIMMGPIFFLSYYSQIGIAQAFFRGKKSNLKKNKKTAFFYYIAILGILTTVYSFFKILILILTDSLDGASNPLEAQGAFWPVVMEFIRTNSDLFTQEQIDTFLAFFAILPTSFSMFIITTCIFGLLGFYAKFLSKEPLNTPKMVLFAAYIITGIAFTIFINAIVNFPYAFPTQFLNSIGFPLDTRDLVDQKILLRIFAVPLLVEKSINLIFLINFLFRKKTLRDQVEKSILNQAIMSEDLQVFGKYLTHKDTRIRTLLVDHLLDYIRLQPRMTPGVKTQISKIFAQFLFDPDESIQQKLLHSLNLILENIEVETQYAIAQRLLEENSSSSIKLSFQVLYHMLEQHSNDPDEHSNLIFHLPEYVLRSGTPEIQSNLMNFMNKLKRKNLPETQNFIFYLLQTKNRFNLLFAYNFIAQFPNIMKDQTLSLVPIMENHLKQMDIELATGCFHTFVRIAVNEVSLIPKVMAEFNNLTLKEYPIIREKIGALVQFNLAQPEWFSQFFAYLKIYLEDPNTQIVADSTVALGIMATPISLESFFSEIYPYFSKLIQSGNLLVKKAVISSLIVIAQTRKDIYKDERFQRLFTLLIVDPHPDIRHQTYRFFIQGDPKYILMDIAVLLKTPLELSIRIDLLNVLSQISSEIIPYVDDLSLYDILTTQPIGEMHNLNYIALEKIHELQQDKSTIFGFNSFNQTFSLYDAVVALLYEITYDIPEKYDLLLNFTRQYQKYEGDLSLAKKLEFYCKIVFDELSLTRIFGINYSLADLITMIQSDFVSIQSHGAGVLLEYLPQIYKKNTDYHREIFEIYASIYVQVSKKNLPITIKSRGDLLLGMVQIIVDNQDLYFTKMNFSLLPKRKEIMKNPFKYTVSPFILNCMGINDAQMQRNLLHSMNLLVDNLTEKQFVRDFLINTLQKTSNPNMKISAMKSFTALPIIIEEQRNINIFLSQLKSKQAGVKAQTIESLGFIVRAFPTIPIKGKGKNANLVRKILYKGFYDQYSISADISIRTTIIHQLQTIILIQPNFTVSLKILEQLSREQDEKLAFDSIQLFFNYIDFTQKSLGEKLIVLHRYSNSPHHSVQKAIAEKISETWAQKIQISALFPIIINLTTSQFQDIRSMVFEAIFEIFVGHPKVMASFCQNLFKLTKDDNAEVRSDALEVLYRIATTLPINMEDIQKINQISQKLANDPSFEIRLLIGKNLSLMIKNFPQYYPAYVHICINFLRSNHPELIKLTIIACRKLIASNSDLNREIYRKGAKIFKKTQNPLLETLLTDIKGALS